MDDALRLTDINKTCTEIAKQVMARRFFADHILYIESAGRLLGIELAKQLHCTASGLRASRQGNALKQAVAPMFNILPGWVAHEVRRIELNSSFHKQRPGRYVSLSQPLPAHAERIILIDDAVDSGHSMQSAVDFLEKLGFSRSNLLTAVINITSDEPVFIPDIYLYRKLLTFPWSPGSEDWKAYQTLVKQLPKS